MTTYYDFALPGLSERIATLSTETSVLRQAMVRHACPIEGIEQLPVWTAAAQLQAHLRKVFIPDIDSLTAAQRILQTGLAYAINAYPDIGHYIRASSSGSFTVDPEPPTWLLTGLAGMSKTATFDALARAIGPAPLFQASVHTPPRKLLGVMFLTVPSKATNRTMYGQLRMKLGMSANGSARNRDQDLDEVRRELYRQGCLVIVVDESQVVANGAVAGAAFVNLIAYLRRFGLPVIVLGNFSMCHGILSQHSQNRQRLLAAPYIMQPDRPDDPDYVSHLQAYVEACGGILAIEPERDATRICALTGGGSRALLMLVCNAYSEVRSQSHRAGKVKVDLVALERAYGSANYFDFRSEIQLLRQHAFDSSRLPKDLRNPFEAVGDAAVERREREGKTFASLVAREKLEASLSQAERAAIRTGEMEAPQYLPGNTLLETASPVLDTTPAPTAPLVGTYAGVLATRPKRIKRPPPTFDDALRTRDKF